MIEIVPNTICQNKNEWLELLHWNKDCLHNSSPNPAIYYLEEKLPKPKDYQSLKIEWWPVV